MRNWFAEKAGLVTAVVVLVLFAVGLVGLLTQPGARAAGLPSGATPYERETELLALTGGINTNNGRFGLSRLTTIVLKTTSGGTFSNLAVSTAPSFSVGSS